jgi:hypothetical protein
MLLRKHEFRIALRFSEERQGRRPEIDRCRQLEMAISNLSVELRDYI